MLTRWSDFGDFDRMYTWMDELRRSVDRLYEDWPATRALTGGAWPHVALFDTGPSLVARAELPGLTEKDVQLAINADVLTFSGERKTEAPQGWSVHRQERPSVKFSRSVSLPAPVDAEKTIATLRNGVLTITMPKAPEAQPKRIAIKA